jgi:hypothetical protein
MESFKILLMLLLVSGSPLAASAARAAESPTATAQPWGPPAAGLALSLTVEGDVTVGGSLRIKVALKTAAGQAVALPPAKDLSGWLVVGQGAGGARKAVYGEKVFPFRDAAGWPAELAGEKVLASAPIDLGAGAAYASEDAKQLLTAYLAAAAEKPAAMPKPAGAMNKVLAPGRAVAKFNLCLPGAGGPPTVLVSNPVEVTVAPPDFAALPADARQALLADLQKQFDRDAWSGQQAHDTAVRIGKAALPSLLVAAFEKDRPAHARLWLATALADLRDPRSAAALIQLLDDPADGVRNVVAYHGPKQNSPELDKAIAAKAAAPGQSGLAAWALLGFLVHRGTAPEELVKAGLESDDPRARATAAETLAAHAGDSNIARLVGLLADKDERVRGTAAGVLGKSGVKSRAVIGGLVKALDLAGDGARQKITAALGELTGRRQPYDPGADEAARARTLDDWRQWWTREKGQ